MLHINSLFARPHFLNTLDIVYFAFTFRNQSVRDFPQIFFATIRALITYIM